MLSFTARLLPTSLSFSTPFISTEIFLLSTAAQNSGFYVQFLSLEQMLILELFSEADSKSNKGVTTFQKSLKLIINQVPDGL